MTDIPIKIQFVKALSNLKPNRLIVKKADNESVFSLFVTDKNSLPFAIKDNTSTGSGIQTLINIDGTLAITSGLNKVINISPATMAVINSALQSGDNISTLNNNVGYITLADLPDTKAEFNSLLSDGNFLFENDIFQYTDEQAQDAVGTILTDTATIDLSYNDLTNQISATVQTNSITANELSDTINISEFVNDEGYVLGTNLTTTHNGTNVIVNSDNGTDATINLANGITAGVSENNLTSIEKAKLANQSGVNTGDQTSIVGITGTKAQFNTAVTDGNILFVGDVTQYTNEDAQDAVGNILTDSSTIDFTYSDGGNTISASVKPNSITASELSNSINVSEFTNDSGYINHADLTVTHNPSNVVINSDVGTDATINLGNGTTAGVSLNNYSTAEKTKLAGISAGAQVNVLETLSSTGGTVTVGSNTSKNINLEVIQATESQLGGGQIVTQAIIENDATTDDTKTVTAKKFWQGWNKGLTLTSFFNAVRSMVLTGLSLTSSRIAALDTILLAFGKTQQQINELQATRFISGNGVSINGVNSAKFDIQVVGKIVDPITFAETSISVNLTSQTPIYIASQVESYIWVNSSNTVVQSLTPPTPDLFDSIVGYWVLVHSNLTNINLINSFPYYADGVAIKLEQLLSFIGFSKFPNTNIPSAGTTGTRIQHSGGFAIKAGLGNTTKRPIMNLIGAVDPSNMEMRHRNGVFSSGVQNIDVTNYNPSGSTVSALANNRYGAHKIWKFASGILRIQYGQKEYANYSEAVAGITVDSFADEGNAFRNGLHIGWLIFKKGTSWGSGGTGVDGVDYKFVDVKSNGSTGGLVPTEQSVYDVSNQPQVTVNDTKGAKQVKNGRASDASSIFEILNIAGAIKSYFTGNGDLFLNGGITDVQTHLNSTIRVFNNTTVASAPVTGTVTDTIVSSILIPANTFTTGSNFDIRMFITKTGANAAAVYRIYTNTAISLSSPAPVIIGSLSGSATQLFAPIKRNVILRSGETARINANNSSNDDSLITATATTVNFDPTVNNYFLIVVTPSSASDSFVCESIMVKGIR